MKRIIALLLICLVFIFSFSSALIVSAEDNVTTFYLEDIPDTEATKHIVTYISVKNNVGFNAVTFVLSFDSTKLAFVLPENGNDTVYDNEIADTLSVAYGPITSNGTQRLLIDKSGVDDFSDNTKLIKLEFEIIGNVSSGELVSIDLSIPADGRPGNNNEQYVEATSVGTQVKITAKSGWNTVGENTYYVDADGNNVKGNYKIDNVLYYFDKNTGALQYSDGYMNNVYYRFNANKSVLSIQGDVTGNLTVDAQDLVRLKKKIAGQNVEINNSSSDVNGDGNVSTQDLVRLKKYIAGQTVLLEFFTDK